MTFFRKASVPLGVAGNWAEFNREDHVVFSLEWDRGIGGFRVDLFVLGDRATRIFFRSGFEPNASDQAFGPASGWARALSSAGRIRAEQDRWRQHPIRFVRYPGRIGP